MPKRVREKTLTGFAGQGADSWVKIKVITVEEALSMQLPPLVIPEGTSEDDAAVLKAEHETKQELLGRERLAEFVLDWNWVDDDDQPMPKPFQNPDVFRKLTTAEIMYLARSVGSNEDGLAKKK